MATPQQSPETRLQIRRTFAAPREKVFRAWTARQALEQWMCRDKPDHVARYLELDVRTGGRFVLEIKNGKGEVYLQQGTYREVKPPEKIVFTWSWKKTPATPGDLTECPETLVTLEFFDRGAQTEIVLTHEGFTSATMRDAHTMGWTGCFDVLEKVLPAQ
jgi:uncharacterized protein YndB with AHSA1/START domain